MNDPIYYPVRRLPAPDPDYQDADFTVIGEEREVFGNVAIYLEIARKHLVKIVAVVLAMVAGAAVRDMRIAPTYTATATLLLKTNQAPILADTGIGTTQAEANTYYAGPEDQTQLELLRSRSLAARVILQQGLLTSSAIGKGLGKKASVTLTTRLYSIINRWLGRIHSTKGNITKPVTADAESSTVAVKKMAVPGGVVDGYLGSLNISPVPETSMVRVSFSSHDPKLAAKVANAHSRAFIQRGIELNTQASEEAEEFLQGKLTELKQQVEQSEVAVNDYRRAKGIIPGLISIAPGGKQDVVLQRLDKLNNDLQEAHLKTISLGAQMALVKQGKAEALPAVLESPLIQALKTELDKLRSDYAALSGQFKPDYPPMQQLDSKIKGSEATLNQEIENAISDAKEKYALAKEQEKSLGDELEKEKTFAMGLNDAAIRYLILERDADTNRELYNAVLKRMKDLTVVADVHASNVSMVDEAEPPLRPSAPNPMGDMNRAGMIGLMLGVGLALLLEYLDNTIETPKQAERYLKVPSLAAIPDASNLQTQLSYYGRSRSNGKTTRNGGPVAVVANGTSPPEKRLGNDVILTAGKRSLLAESYRVLRSSLLLSQPGSHPKVTLMTSSFPREGKTTVCVNSAIVLAQTGARVLLIDADLRLSRCHKTLGMGNSVGLTELLTGAAQRNLIRKTPVENLHLLSAGQTPPNPSELLGSKKMKEVLDSFRELYDYVMVDSPPVMLVSDPLLLSSMVDGVVLILGCGETPKQEMREALRRLQFVNAKIFGVVLNKMKIDRVGSPYYYHSYMYNSGYSGYYADLADVTDMGDVAMDEFVDPHDSKAAGDKA